MPSIGHVSILSWNANSISSKGPELDQFLYEQSIDVVLLQETFLKPGDNFQLPNYTLYRNDRVRGRGGGTCILVKRRIPHFSITTPDIHGLEATIIQVKADDFEFRIISCYKPSNVYQIDYGLEALFDWNVPTFLAGDLNSHHRNWGGSFD